MNTLKQSVEGLVKAMEEFNSNLLVQIIDPRTSKQMEDKKAMEMSSRLQSKRRQNNGNPNAPVG